ncbi:glycosyltransferase involved in cell wall biosynthesis [Mycolicibacterium sp. BK556]|uniref:glycosyltransferase family 4 protein n=1 Tax=unclassified Mycolicibacterium TaxID=2636767 RepID=UPI0016094EF9|nr:glycosyltransferase involved in cell wall biosynthesis [Mycolicibacterium sp. BK556]MBB3636776.1 glycosyltransferase involved in cell wall biosynthesis [Mycolicibacterium sp. BK607]
MKVLLLTPYSPLLTHDHAANDIALPLVTALAKLVDLHVYAPGQHHGTLTTWRVDGVTYYSGSPVRLRQIDRFDTYPYAARGSWSRRSTSESTAIAKLIKPDILHAEYSQTAEPLLRSVGPAPTSIMLHDLPGEVAVRPRDDLSALRYWLQRLERAKTLRLRDAILERIDALFVFSERDKAKAARSRGAVDVAPVGVSVPAEGWAGNRAHTAAFGGALWRLENEVTAVYLAREVMPLVRAQIPDAELRIFGARPSPDVRALGSYPGVTVVGEVEDYDAEFRNAAVTLAPTMVDAGILMKAIRAMAMGCPVVLNPASAGPIAGLNDGEHALVGDSPADIARHVVTLINSREYAGNLGRSARGLVQAHFSWQRTVEVYLTMWRRLLGE